MIQNKYLERELLDDFPFSLDDDSEYFLDADEPNDMYADIIKNKGKAKSKTKRLYIAS